MPGSLPSKHTNLTAGTSPAESPPSGTRESQETRLALQNLPASPFPSSGAVPRSHFPPERPLHRLMKAAPRTQVSASWTSRRGPRSMACDSTTGWKVLPAKGQTAMKYFRLLVTWSCCYHSTLPLSQESSLQGRRARWWGCVPTKLYLRPHRGPGRGPFCQPRSRLMLLQRWSSPSTYDTSPRFSHIFVPLGWMLPQRSRNR